MLSICIGHLNRSNISRCIESLNSATVGIVSELVIADYDTANPVSRWILAASRLPVSVIACDGQFSYGGARNIAASRSQGDIIYFCDADMLTPKEVVLEGIQTVKNGNALFPYYKRYNNAENKEWTWGNGHGNSFVSRKHYLESGGFPVRTAWGGEDTEFARWFDSRGLMIRKNFESYYHLHHTK